VAGISCHVNVVEAVNHPLFERAAWTFRFRPSGRRTLITCSIDMVVRWRYLLVLPMLRLARRSIMRDLASLRALIEADEIGAI
jgi:hypothetical protein